MSGPESKFTSAPELLPSFVGGCRAHPSFPFKNQLRSKNVGPRGGNIKSNKGG